MSGTILPHGRPRSVPDHMRARVVDLCEAGHPVRAIARDLGIAYGTVYWICLAEGADSPNAKPTTGQSPGPTVVERNGRTLRRYTADDDADLLALEAQGIRISEIGRRLRRHPSSVLARLATLARREARAEAAGGACG